MRIHDYREGIHLQPDAATCLRESNLASHPISFDRVTVLASWTANIQPLLFFGSSDNDRPV
jgi:hypothetical protein